MASALDPSQPFQAFTVRPTMHGHMPVLRAQVGVRQAASLGPSQHDPQDFNAIWDTGCTMTSISPLVAERLGLKPFSVATVHAANSTYECPVFKVDIRLPNGLAILGVNVTQAQNIRGADLLIGMDIINTGDLAITNAGGDTFFSFRFPPALRHIDYVEQANALTNAHRPSWNEHDRQALIRHLKKKGKLR